MCTLQSKVSSLEAAERKRKEREREASMEGSVREDRISKLQEELDKKVRTHVGTTDSSHDYCLIVDTYLTTYVCMAPPWIISNI